MDSRKSMRLQLSHCMTSISSMSGSWTPLMSFSACAFCAGAFSAFLASSRLLADHGCVSTGSKTSESALGSCAEARNAGAARSAAATAVASSAALILSMGLLLILLYCSKPVADVPQQPAGQSMRAARRPSRASGPRVTAPRLFESSR